MFECLCAVMKVLTWNINGIRAGQEKVGMKRILDSLAADVVCLQETKVTRDMLDEPTAIVDGYESYFSFSRKRTGYSGTANYCRSQTAPVKAEEGLTGRLSTAGHSIVGFYGNMSPLSGSDLDAIDSEGRCTITQHRVRLGDVVTSIAIINVYVPRSGSRQDRLEYKIKFLSVLQCRAEALIKQGIHVIIVGDLNLTHKRLDNCDPDTDEEFQRSSSRIWINNLLQVAERDSSLPKSDGILAQFGVHHLEGGGFSDVYRYLHPTHADAFTNWNTTTDARKANYGRRLDYILVDSGLADRVTSCEILVDFEGSDHCPVMLCMDCDPVTSLISPMLCSKHMPEFKGQQQKLSVFFSKVTKQEQEESECNDGNQSCPLRSTDDVVKPSLFSSPPKKSTSFSTAQTKPLLKKMSQTLSDFPNSKKARLKNDESLSKQISLTSFFPRVGVTKKASPFEAQSDCVDLASWAAQNDNNTCVDALCRTSETITLDRPNPATEHSSSVGMSRLSSETATEDKSDAASAPEDKPDAASSQRSNDQSSSTTASQAWKSLLKGLRPAPLCPGHREPCILKTVKKSGPNKNKQFFMCARPDGAPGKTEFRCNFFQWLNNKKKK